MIGHCGQGVAGKIPLGLKSWARSLVSVSWRRLFDAIGKEIAQEITQSSLLVLAPHPDDETLGCGATIVHCRGAGRPVTVVVASDGRLGQVGFAPSSELADVRREELVKGVSVLCEPELVWLGYADGTLSHHEAEMTAQIERLILEHRPDFILSTSASDPHPDHAAVGRVARIVARRTGVSLLEYPIRQWTTVSGWLGWGTSKGSRERWGRPRLVRIDDESRAKKRLALSYHKSQLPLLGGSLDSRFLATFLRSREYFWPVVQPRSPRRPAGR